MELWKEDKIWRWKSLVELHSYLAFANPHWMVVEFSCRWLG